MKTCTKTIATIIGILSCVQLTVAQVGIGNTNPKATLDITASNTTTPTNTDGILIPRVANFPATNPTANQDGMLIFATGTGTPSKGFYYWDNSAGNWVSVIKNDDIDWYKEGTTTAPNNINDNIYTHGNVAIGKNTANYSLDIESVGVRGISTKMFGSNNNNIYSTYNNVINTGSGTHTGSYNLLTGVGNGQQVGSWQEISNSGNNRHIGSYNRLSGAGFGNKYGTYQNIISAGNGDHFGSYNRLLGTGNSDHVGTYQYIDASGYGRHYGSANILSGTGGGFKCGSYNIIHTAAGGIHYGVYSEVRKASGYAGYFIGRMSLGNTAANRYLMPVSDGPANYIMQTDGVGQVSFVDPTSVGTDNQNIAGSGLSGTNLIIGIQNGTSQVINLASLQDGNTQNTLDQAYDEGGLGAGRTINTTNGSLRLNGNDGLEIRGASAGIVIANHNENESGIHFKDSGNTTQYADINYDNANASNSLNFYVNNNTTPLLRLDDNQNVGIKRIPVTNDLEVNGTASKATAGSWLANSDKRLKKNITTIKTKTALDKITQLRGITYEWNDAKTGIDRPTGVQYGFIAQEIKTVFPSKVSKDSLGYYQTAYGDYDALFVQAFKELKQEIEMLQQENKRLQNQISGYQELQKSIIKKEKTFNTINKRLENLEALIQQKTYKKK